MTIFDAVIQRNKQELIRAIEQGHVNDHDSTNGYTALHYCAQANDIELAKIIIEHGAEIDSVDHFGNTPLFKATFFSGGKKDMVLLLIHAGANINQKNNSNVSPKDLAESIGSFDITDCFKLKDYLPVLQIQR